MIPMEPYQESVCFQNTELTDELLSNLEFADCSFENCTLENFRLSRCRFSNCTFIGCSILNLQADHCSMADCSFSHCDLSGINWSDLMFGGGYMIPIRQLEGCRLKYNNFVQINFTKFDFSGNSIAASMFADCNLSASSFTKCELERTEFFKCDLTKADFRLASGYQIDLATNQIKGAKFSFPEVVNLLDSLGITID